MKEALVKLALGSLCLLVGPASPAQSDTSPDTSGLQLEPTGPISPNRFGLAYRMGFNTHLSFRNLGGYAPVSSRLTPSGDPYNYDDGYVYNDPNQGAFGVTWYWGYDAAPGQYTLGSDALIMHRSSSQADLAANETVDSPSQGFEVTYNRELVRSKRVRAGLEAAFGYTYLKAEDSQALRGDVTVARDSYEVPVDPSSGYGVTYFPTVSGTGQPYQHGFALTPNLDNPVIGNSPTSLSSQTISGGAQDIGSRSFHANLYGFRVGPYLGIPLSRRLGFDLSGGFALVYIQSEFSFNETVAIAGLSPQAYSGSSSASGWRPGGYVAGTFSYAFAEDWAVAAGAQFLDVGHYTHSAGGKEAVLDLTQSLFVTIGVSHSF